MADAIIPAENPIAWDINSLIAHIPGISASYIRKCIMRREIPHYHVGRRIYFNPDEIKKWVFKSPVNAIKPDIISTRREIKCYGNTGKLNSIVVS